MSGVGRGARTGTVGCMLSLWVSAVPELTLVWELPLPQELFPSALAVNHQDVCSASCCRCGSWSVAPCQAPAEEKGEMYLNVSLSSPLVISSLSSYSSAQRVICVF